jgi:putative membrane protein
MGTELLLPRPSRLRTVPASLGCTAVVLQIAYPLVHGTERDRLTVAIVIVFAAACVAHAIASRGTTFGVAMLALTAGPGFAVEVLGVHSGVPFGSYTYGTTLGPRLFEVPLVIGLAWTMLAWPAAIAAQRLASSFVSRVLLGAWALATADLFLDPQLVAAGQWTWHSRDPHLPGVASVPLSNYGGWLLAALVLSLAVQALLTTSAGGPDTLPVALYLWLYAGWVVALAVFLHLPAAAGWGALGMGTVAVPLARRVLR